MTTPRDRRTGDLGHEPGISGIPVLILPLLAFARAALGVVMVAEGTLADLGSQL